MTEPIVTASGLPIYTRGSDSSSRAVIVIQEAFGVNDHILDVTQRFADHGYFAVAPVLFHRDGSITAPYDDFQQAMAALGNLTRDGLTDDVVATAQFLNSKGFAAPNIGIVGYCMGGGIALYADTLGVVGAAVSFYGGGVQNGRFGLPSLIELAPELKSPWLGLYGDLDQGIPVEQVEALREAAATSLTSTDIIRYADGAHGFHCNEREAVYNPVAAADAAQRTYDFFAANLTDR